MSSLRVEGPPVYHLWSGVSTSEPPLENLVHQKTTSGVEEPPIGHPTGRARPPADLPFVVADPPVDLPCSSWSIRGPLGVEGPRAATLGVTAEGPQMDPAEAEGSTSEPPLERRVHKWTCLRAGSPKWACLSTNERTSKTVKLTEHTYIYIYIYVSVHTYTRTSLYTHIYTDICVLLCMCVSIRVLIYPYTHVRTLVYMSMYTDTYTYTQGETERRLPPTYGIPLEWGSTSAPPLERSAHQWISPGVAGPSDDHLWSGGVPHWTSP